MSTPLSSPEAVRALLARTFDLTPEELEDDTLLFSSGRLDSFNLVELIAILEKDTGHKIAAGDINLENFDSPRRIAALMTGGA